MTAKTLPDRKIKIDAHGAIIIEHLALVKSIFPALALSGEEVLT
jgi:hypothetical protein